MVDYSITLNRGGLSVDNHEAFNTAFISDPNAVAAQIATQLDQVTNEVPGIISAGTAWENYSFGVLNDIEVDGGGSLRDSQRMLVDRLNQSLDQGDNNTIFLTAASIIALGHMAFEPNFAARGYQDAMRSSLDPDSVQVALDRVNDVLETLTPTADTPSAPAATAATAATPSTPTAPAASGAVTIDGDKIMVSTASGLNIELTYSQHDPLFGRDNEYGFNLKVKGETSTIDRKSLSSLGMDQVTAALSEHRGEIQSAMTGILAKRIAETDDDLDAINRGDIDNVSQTMTNNLGSIGGNIGEVIDAMSIAALADAVQNMNTDPTEITRRRGQGGGREWTETVVADGSISEADKIAALADLQDDLVRANQVLGTAGIAAIQDVPAATTPETPETTPDLAAPETPADAATPDPATTPETPETTPDLAAPETPADPSVLTEPAPVADPVPQHWFHRGNTGAGIAELQCALGVDPAYQARLGENWSQYDDGEIGSRTQSVVLDYARTYNEANPEATIDPKDMTLAEFTQHVQDNLKPDLSISVAVEVPVETPVEAPVETPVEVAIITPEEPTTPVAPTVDPQILTGRNRVLDQEVLEQAQEAVQRWQAENPGQAIPATGVLATISSGLFDRSNPMLVREIDGQIVVTQIHEGNVQEIKPGYALDPKVREKIIEDRETYKGNHEGRLPDHADYRGISFKVDSNTGAILFDTADAVVSVDITRGRDNDYDTTLVAEGHGNGHVFETEQLADAIDKYDGTSSERGSSMGRVVSEDSVHLRRHWGEALDDWESALRHGNASGLSVTFGGEATSEQTAVVTYNNGDRGTASFEIPKSLYDAITTAASTQNAPAVKVATVDIDNSLIRPS